MPWRHLRGKEEKPLLILNLGTRRGWVVSITPRPHFTPGERAPGNHCTGGWVGPRASLDAEARGIILCLCRVSNPGRSVRSQILYWLSYPGFSSDIRDMFKFIVQQKLSEVYPIFFILLKTTTTVPVASASAERRFSRLKLIKTYLRTTMAQERLQILWVYSFPKGAV
jgi:hypothetical protein